jgi:hypothetical protein
MTHLKSKHYRVLLGAMNLLKEPYERIFHVVIHPKGMEEIRGVTGKNTKSGKRELL